MVFRINVDLLDTTGRLDVREFIGIVNHTAHPLVMNDKSVRLTHRKHIRHSCNYLFPSFHIFHVGFQFRIVRIKGRT